MDVMCCESESSSVVSNTLWPHELYSPWNSPGQSTGAGSLSLLHKIFPTPGIEPGLLHCRWILYQLSHWGNHIPNAKVNYDINRAKINGRNIRYSKCLKLYMKWHIIWRFSSVQSLSWVWFFATPWTAACQASLFITNSKSPPKPMSIELVMPSNHLIFCSPLFLLPSIFPSIRVFSNESALCIRWPKY